MFPTSVTNEAQLQEGSDALLQVKDVEVIILAGGLGTRLRSAVPDLPKCMAPVNGKPFLGYVIDYFLQQGAERFILSLGYKQEAITEYITSAYPSLSVQFVIENEPLGTGGAIQLASKEARGHYAFITNGDTLFSVDLQQLLNQRKNCVCSLSLKPMQQFERYGVVEIDTNGLIKSFKEKQYYEEGFINGGLYLLDIPTFLSLGLPEKFSFEKEYLEAFYQTIPMKGLIQDAYFIDIGIPTDYQQAQTDFLKL